MRLIVIILAAIVVAAGPVRDSPRTRDSRNRAPRPTADQKPLAIYFVDVEGGQATLIVSPSGESMLVDAGFPGFDGRDAGRIEAAAKQAGVTRIDYMVVTHYHRDHVGGVPEVARRLPVGTFVDHGSTVEHGEQPDALYRDYLQARERGRHLEVKPGDRIPIGGLDVQVVSSAGAVLPKPLPGGGAPNPLCADFKRKDDDPTENARSVGMVIAYGSFRMVDLGDLTWNREHDLACPNNLLGTVDLYLTTHHGMPVSGAPVLVQGLRPRVAIMNNGAHKGGSAEAWKVIRTSPGLQDFWQLHYAVDAGSDANVPPDFIANLDESTAHGLTVTANRDGSFAVTNSRNGLQKTYVAHPQR